MSYSVCDLRVWASALAKYVQISSWLLLRQMMCCGSDGQGQCTFLILRVVVRIYHHFYIKLTFITVWCDFKKS